MKSDVLRGQGGFTILDILVSTALGTMVIVGYLSMATFQVSTAQGQAEQVDLQQTVRDVTELFAREVRRTGSDPTCAGTFDGVDFAAYWGIRLKSDLDGSGAIDGPDESILYLYNSGNFMRYEGNSSELLISGVGWGGSRIHYFDADGEEIGGGNYPLDSDDRDEVRRVQIVLDVDRETPHGETIKAQASTDINLRNRFFVATNGCGGAA